MGFYGAVRRPQGYLPGLLLLGGAFWLAVACSSSTQKGPESPEDDSSGPPPACQKDETREYFCDDLLPTSHAKPAPDPYTTCPGSIGVKGSVFPATSSVARFDVARTEWTRKRVPPGHSCCYSWCSKLALGDVAAVDAAACSQPNAMKEQLCVNESEAGVSEGAAPPNERCASALVPPAGVAFSAPKAAALDLSATGQRRAQGLRECCYGWCSKAPLGTGLGPK